MLAILNERLFLALNASSQPDPLVAGVAAAAASWLVYAAMVLVAALWVRGRRDARGALLATVVGVNAALGINQLLGLCWYEPRPFMIGLGHTLVSHAVDNSFPSDHATFMWSLGFGLIATGAARGWGVLVCLCGLLVAWARVYLGLHFPIDMAGSLVVGAAGGGIARLARPAIARWLDPATQRVYEATLRSLRLPPVLFPRRP